MRKHQPSPNKLTALAAILVLALGTVPATTTPLAAQPRGSGFYDQPYQSNIFNPLMSGRFSMLFQVTGEAANNVLDLGDAVAIMRIAEDENEGLRPSDILLIGGLVPEGSGLRLDSRAAFDLTMGIVPTRFGILGITTGVRVHAAGSVPDELAGFLRDGVQGDTLTIDFGEMYGAGLGYAHAGVLVIGEIPTADFLPVPELRLRAGLGLRGVFGIGHMAFDFKEGDRGSKITVDHDGIDAQITTVMPVEFANPGGSGLATDLFLAADYADILHANFLISNIGSVEMNVAEREAVRIDLTRGELSEFFEQLDSLVTDTIPATTQSLRLPGLVRFEAGYQPHRMVGVGFLLESGFGDRFVQPGHVGLMLELRPLRFFPIRLGVNRLGGGYGTGMHGGFGLHLGPFRWDLDVGTRGAGSFDKTRGGALRTGFGLQF